MCCAALRFSCVSLLFRIMQHNFQRAKKFHVETVKNLRQVLFLPRRLWFIVADCGSPQLHLIVF